MANEVTETRGVYRTPDQRVVYWARLLFDDPETTDVYTLDVGHTVVTLRVFDVHPSLDAPATECQPELADGLGRLLDGYAAAVLDGEHGLWKGEAVLVLARANDAESTELRVSPKVDADNTGQVDVYVAWTVGAP